MMDEKILDGYVTYEAFGARGDGVTDDIEAIKAAHDYANEHRLNVRTNPNATYYIGSRPITVTVKTCVDWGTSKFIIDDREVKIEERRASVFKIASYYDAFEFHIDSLKKNQMKLDVNFERNCYVKVENSEKKQFIRYGLNCNSGSSQTDCFVMDGTGYILNPVIWDFEKVTSAVARPIDETLLTVRGGDFTTISNQAESKYNYHSRNIAVLRSNVLLERISHKITGELDHGAPYGGFISIDNCAYVTLRDSFFTGRMIYQTIGAAGKPVSMGSYAILISNCVNVKLENVRQYNIMDGKRWGLMASNHCRDLYLDGCVMSRFDAHENVVNLTIKNTTLGHQCFNAIGHGNMVVENVIAYGNSFLNLRPDYGSSWDGSVSFRNCTWYPKASNTSPAFIGGSNSGGHDFGFPCYMPHEINIENLHICDSEHTSGYSGAKLFDINKTRHNGCGELDYSDCGVKSPYFFTEKVTVKGVVCDSGKGFKLFSDDTAVCFATKRHNVGDGMFKANFRALIEDTELSCDSIIPVTSLTADDFESNYHLVPRIELKNCTNFVYKKGNTPAVIMLNDCAVKEFDTNGAAKIFVSE